MTHWCEGHFTTLPYIFLVFWSVLTTGIRVKNDLASVISNHTVSSGGDQHVLSYDSDIPLRRKLIGYFVNAAHYGLNQKVTSSLNELPSKIGTDIDGNRLLHFSFSTQMGTELGYAYHVMLSLVRKGHDVTLCARTFRSPAHSSIPGISEGVVNKLTVGGVRVVEPPASGADINDWWKSNYHTKVDLFVEDMLTIDQEEFLFMPKSATMKVAEATTSPLSCWAGNPWLLWNRVRNHRFPPPLPNKLYPSFVANWNANWEPSFANVEEPELAEPLGEKRWRSVGGAKVAFVRKSVSAAGAPNDNEKIELDKVAKALARKPTSKVVLFVLGTQGPQISFKGYQRIIEDLSNFDAVVVLVLVKPTDWIGEWTNTIQPEENARITQAWRKWYTQGGKEGNKPSHLPANLILTTYVPQAQLLSFYGDRTILISGMGASSLAEAVDAEVPIVGFPLQADQPDNSKTVQTLGVGVNRSEIVVEMIKSKDIQLPYGDVWVQRILQSVAPGFAPNEQLNGIDISLSAALEHISSNWDIYKEGIRKLKSDLAKLTFSQEEVAAQYISWLQ